MSCCQTSICSNWDLWTAQPREGCLKCRREGRTSFVHISNVNKYVLCFVCTFFVLKNSNPVWHALVRLRHKYLPFMPCISPRRPPIPCHIPYIFFFDATKLCLSAFYAACSCANAISECCSPCKDDDEPLPGSIKLACNVKWCLSTKVKRNIN